MCYPGPLFVCGEEGCLEIGTSPLAMLSVCCYAECVERKGALRLAHTPLLCCVCREEGCLEIGTSPLAMLCVWRGRVP